MGCAARLHTCMQSSRTLSTHSNLAHQLLQQVLHVSCGRHPNPVEGDLRVYQLWGHRELHIVALPHKATSAALCRAQHSKHEWASKPGRASDSSAALRELLPERSACTARLVAWSRGAPAPLSRTLECKPPCSPHACRQSAQPDGLQCVVSAHEGTSCMCTSCMCKLTSTWHEHLKGAGPACRSIAATHAISGSRA